MNIHGSRHYSKLASDFITAFDSTPIKNFFPYSPYERGEELRKLVEHRAEEAAKPSNKELRKELIAALKKQHSNAGSLTAEVEKNLKLLESERCMAVVTGQQVGIMGGPLYTIYKALHTVVLAKELSKDFPGYHFVPVFWQETEDHDFEETNNINIITSGFELRNIVYKPDEDVSRRQIGGLKLEKDATETFFSEMETYIQATDFTEEVLGLYKSAYQDDLTFAEAQARLLGDLLAEDGLLILNPNSKELKQHASFIFKKELDTAPLLSDTIQTRSKELTAQGYHVQLDPQGANLFIADNGKRFKLTKTETGFSYDDKAITNQEAEGILNNAPERYSMNVVMRPLVQDTILPTVAYVAGPGEIAYFAQLKVAYDWAGIKMPVIVPRFGMTIVEERFEKLLKKHTLTIEELLEQGNDAIKAKLKSEQEALIAERFAAASGGVDNILELLRGAVNATEPTLDGALSTLKGKLLTGIKDFESKTLAAERKKQSETRGQLEKMLHVLLPDGKLQERELILFYFINKYGLGVWKGIKKLAFSGGFSLREHTIISVRELLK